MSKKLILQQIIIIYFVIMTAPLLGTERPDFDSYEEAIIWVRGNDNFVKDNLNTSKSSWIKAAEYFNDGSEYGFLILNMKGREYIWEDVPVSVWTGFKNAESFGKYYHENIKGNYYMNLEK